MLICIFFASFLSRIESQTLSYNQIRIPLDATLGIPFTKDEHGEYYIEGFDIDEKGNFFFLSGYKATISCFTGNKNVFRKKYEDFNPGQLHIQGDKLYFFESKYNKNNLIVLSKSNGNLISVHKKITTKTINSYLFFDSSLILNCFGNTSTLESLEDFEYNFNGKLMRENKNFYNLQNSLQIEKELEFLGKWNNDYVFGKYDIDEQKYKVYLKNGYAKIVDTAFISLKQLGKPLCGDLDCMPLEHRKIRNGILYMLNRIDKNAIITIIPITKIFKNV